VFTNGYKEFWTTKIFKVESIKQFHPEAQYWLMDENHYLVDGLFYEAELQVVQPESI
jgi:hypothetical protein